MKYNNFLILLTLNTVCAQFLDVGTALNDYIELDEPDYNWYDTGDSFPTLLGGQAYRLNVTSLKWLNDSIYEVEGVENGSVWTHQVVVVVPKVVEYRNMSTLYMASVNNKRNKDPPTTDLFDFEITMADLISANTKAICVVAY